MLISNADLTRTAIGTIIAVLAFAVIVINTTRPQAVTVSRMRTAKTRTWLQYNFGQRRGYQGKHWAMS